MNGTTQTFGEPIPMTPWGQVIFCHFCSNGKKIGHRAHIVSCTVFSGEGRCENCSRIPDTELVKPWPRIVPTWVAHEAQTHHFRATGSWLSL